MRRGVGVGAPSLQLELLTVSNDEGRFAFTEHPAGRFMLAASNPYGRWRTLWAEVAARFDENVFQTGAWILPDERPSRATWKRFSKAASHRCTSVLAALARRRMPGE